MKEKLTNMKEAAIENVFVWIVLFATFASIFFFIINYTTITRTIDTIDSLAEFGANHVGTNGVGADLSTIMNEIATKNISTISADTNTICTTVDNSQYKVIFNVTSTNTSLYFYSGQLSSKKVVFNQDTTGDTITCNLSVTIQE